MREKGYAGPHEIRYEVWVEFIAPHNYITLRDVYVNGKFYYYDEEGGLLMKEGGIDNFRLYANEENSGGGYRIKMLKNASESPKLIQMDCRNNQLIALNFLSEDIQLLYCRNNELTSIDIPSFANNLASFDCAQNQIRSLDLSRCSKLEGINCEYNPITSLDVSNCERLNDLDFSYTQVRSVNLGNIPIRIIHCTNTPLAENYESYRSFLLSLPARSASEVGYISPYPAAGSELAQILNSKNWVEG